VALTSSSDACVQDKDKLPAPLKSMDLRAGFKGGIREESPSDVDTDRIIHQTVGITASHGGPGNYCKLTLVFFCWSSFLKYFFTLIN